MGVSGLPSQAHLVHTFCFLLLHLFCPPLGGVMGGGLLAAGPVRVGGSLHAQRLRPFLRPACLQRPAGWGGGAGRALSRVS